MPANGGLVSRDDVVLVVVDVQERLAAAMERRDEVVATTARLIRTAGLIGAPVLVTRQYPEGLGDTVAEVGEALAEVAGTVPITTVDKVTFCACAEPAFVEALTGTGRQQVVIAGMESHICVTQTALAVAGLGVEVYVVADACCSRRAADHDTAMDRLRAAGIVVTTSESVMYEAVATAGTNEFKRLLTIVKGA